MNNNIKQLAEQAELNVTLLFNKDKLERFAELIISECVNQLTKPEYAINHPEDLSSYNRGWVNGRLVGIEHIEQHFRGKE